MTTFRILLLIHDSALIRKRLMEYISSELDDVKIMVARYEHEVEGILDSQKVDIIISGNQMKNFNVLSVLNQQKQSPLNRTTPLIVLTSTTTQSHIKELEYKGVQHVIFPPHTSTSLIHKINELYDPRKLRSEPRFFVPGASALIHLESSDVKAKIINISQKAIRCEFRMEALNDNILKGNYLSLLFPGNYNNVIIRDIWSKILNIKILSWQADLIAKTFQAVWLFEDFGENKNDFLKILTQIENQIHAS